MHTSARNCLPIKITSIQEGVTTSLIQGVTKNSATLSATITLNSQKELELSKDKEIYFLFKASSVIISKDKELKFSARNRLCCKIKEIKIGAVNSEITMSLNNGDEICAVITNQSTQRLNLKVDDEVLAVIKSSSIIVACK